MGMDKWTLWHVGMTVSSLSKTLDYLTSIGAGVDGSRSWVTDSAKMGDRLLTYGKSGAPPWKTKGSMLPMGPLTLEVVEPIEGGNYREAYLKEHGDGVDHVAYVVDNIESEIQELSTKGVPVIYHVKGVWAQLDSRSICGLGIELVQKGINPTTLVSMK